MGECRNINALFSQAVCQGLSFLRYSDGFHYFLLGRSALTRGSGNELAVSQCGLGGWGWRRSCERFYPVVFIASLEFFFLAGSKIDGVGVRGEFILFQLFNNRSCTIVRTICSPL